MGSFLEFLYTGEYFPRKVPGQRVLEHDPSAPGIDDSGDHLLRHARIYTLAEKFGMELLKKLASSKIHCISSTARGELAYARYVYANTAPDDAAVRAPIASFWAARSHALRAEAEVEFKSLCLEHPQFGYDVLSKFFLCFGDGRDELPGLKRRGRASTWQRCALGTGVKDSMLTSVFHSPCFG